MLVDLERVVHVSLHLGADSGQPDAVGRPAKARQDSAEGTTRRFGGRPPGGVELGPGAAATQRVDRTRPRPYPHRLLAGLRADELLRANVGDLRRTDDGAVIHLRGKGGKDRRIPIESALVAVLEHYLDSRRVRFPATAKQRSSPGRGLAAWPPAAPLFVGADGDRIALVAR